MLTIESGEWKTTLEKVAYSDENGKGGVRQETKKESRQKQIRESGGR